MSKALLILLLFAGWITKPEFAFTIPARPPQRVADFANLLDTPTETQLLNLVAQVEEQTSAELAVVTVASLEGLTVEDYAHNIFNTWGIGKKGKDNGVLLLVAPNERKTRIEVGYGLESILPDGLCGDIIRQQLIPNFKQGHFLQAILDGTARLSEILIKNEPAPRASSPPSQGWIILTGMISLFMAVGWWMTGGGLAARTSSHLAAGLGFGGVPFLILGLQYPLPWFCYAWFVLVGVVTFRGGFRHGQRHPGQWRGGRKARTRGWITGSGGGRGGSGGGFSSGGGGFGGGSSGGGGASGSW